MTINESFGLAVNATEAFVLPALQQANAGIQQLHFEYGHPQAILKIMMQWSKSTQAVQAKMYPLVGLFQDFTETTPARAGQLPTVSLRVIIANITRAEYTTEQRYDKNFKPILSPVYEELIRQLKISPRFQGVKRPRHDKTDRPFWGREGLYGTTGNIFNDAMDVIEIRNLELVIREEYCSTPGLKTQ